jgi:WD40 repeat protein
MLSCRFDPTGRYVFGGCQESSIARWDLTNGQKVTLQGHQTWVRGLAFIPASNQMISAGYDGKLIWWQADAANPAPLRTVQAHTGWARAVAVSPNGQLVASCGNDERVKLWNAQNGNLVRELSGHNSHVYNVAFHPGGQFLVSGDLEGHVKQWDINQGTVVRTMDATVLSRYDNTFRATIGGVRGMSFNQDGSLLACIGITDVTNAFAGIGKPAIALFNWQSGQRTQLLRPPQNFQGSGWGVFFHPSGFIGGCGGNNTGGLWFWQPDNATSFASINLPSQARDIALHPDGHRLAIAFFDNKVRIYDMIPA